MGADPRVAIVIVHYRAPEDVLGCVAALRGQGRGASDKGEDGPRILRSTDAALPEGTNDRSLELVVVDNGGGASLVPHGEAGAFRLIRNKENRGFAAAANQGLAATTVPVVILANPDLRLAPADALELARLVETEPSIGLAGPALSNEDGSPQASAFPFPTWSHFLWRRLGSAARASSGICGADLSTPREVDWLLGACLAARRETLEALGGFDEDFFLYGEDLDLAWRARARGLRVVLTPGATAMHRGNPRWDAARRVRVHEAQILFFRKTRGRGAAWLLRLLIAFAYAMRYVRHAAMAGPGWSPRGSPAGEGEGGDHGHGGGGPDECAQVFRRLLRRREP